MIDSKQCQPQKNSRDMPPCEVDSFKKETACVLGNQRFKYGYIAQVNSPDELLQYAEWAKKLSDTNVQKLIFTERFLEYRIKLGFVADTLGVKRKKFFKRYAIGFTLRLSFLNTRNNDIDAITAMCENSTITATEAHLAINNLLKKTHKCCSDIVIDLYKKDNVDFKNYKQRTLDFKILLDGEPKLTCNFSDLYM